MFTPLHDGCLDRDQHDDQHDELHEYQDDLDRLDVPVEDADDDHGPEIDTDDTSVPWLE